MSWTLFLITLTAFATIFSEFGGKLRASSAISWWSIAAFLLIAATSPSLFTPVTQFLGIELVSNFVMATTIIFLFLQVLSLSANQTNESRKIRLMISRIAAEHHLRFNPELMMQNSNQKRALIVLPCFNEQGSVEKLAKGLDDIKSRSKGTIDYCFIDDGSTDNTREILSRVAPKNFAHHLVNNNVSGVLLTGFQICLMANFDFVIQCDGDGQHPLDQIERLFQEAQSKQADLLIASRFLKSNNSNSLESTTALRRSGSLLIIALIKFLWPSIKISDPTSGFRVYSKRLCSLLTKDMPDEFPEPETIPLAYVNNFRVCETSVKMSKRTAGVSSINGIKSFIYMYKAIAALIGLRLRTLKNK